jgi:NTP pyrophosphatase (non-canonical NTP hydrolase)
MPEPIVPEKVLFVESDRPIGMAGLDRIRQQLEGKINGWRVVVLDDGLRLSAIHGESIAALQHEIGVWQRATFGGAGEPQCVRAVHKKSEEEDRELMLALAGSGYTANAEVEDELADRLILTLALADRLGVDLAAVSNRKMGINYKRRWPAPRPGEVVRHLEDEAAPAGGCVVPAKILGEDPT